MPPPGRFFDPYGSRFGSPRCPGNGDVRKSCKRAEKTPLSGRKAVFLWLRGLDLNQRPPGYEFRNSRFLLFCNVPQSIEITGFFKFIV